MKKLFKHIFSILLLCCINFVALAQPIYEMQTLVVDDCEGYLFDSQVGGSGGGGDFPSGYGHNERLTFTICVPDVEKIVMSFTFLDTEPDNDYIEFYDGPNTNSPLIARRTGVQGPFTIENTGECLTIYFYTDGSKNAEGWEAFWFSNPPVPEDPNFMPISGISCGDQTVIVEFDKPIPCSAINVPNFSESYGPAGGNITSVNALDCVDGFATRVEITYATPLDESGTYHVEFNYVVAECNGTYELNASTTFNITDCPLELTLYQDTAVCIGTCANLYAEVTGGNPATYVYTWSPTLPNAAVVSACPTVPTTYTVTVSDGQSQPVSASVFVDTLPSDWLPGMLSPIRGWDSPTQLRYSLPSGEKVYTLKE